MRFPSIKDVAHDIRIASKGVDWQGMPAPGDDRECCDIRLQVLESGGWAIHVGPSDYDLDHRGYWGSSCFPRGRFNARELARDLLSQVRARASS